MLETISAPASRLTSPLATRLVAAPLEEKLAALLVAAAVLFNLFMLSPNASNAVPDVNDNVLHLAVTQAAIEAIKDGRDPTDFWLPGIAEGYPLLHHYQHLSYLPPALVSALTGLDASAALRGVTLLLLSLFPLSVFWSLRRIGFTPIVGAGGAVISSLLSANFLYGFDYGSYVWAGSGLYTQLWGMFFLPAALAQGYFTLRTGRGYALVAVLLAATALSHLVVGYIAVISLGLLLLIQPSPAELVTRLKRLVVVFAGFAALTAYFFLPLLEDREFVNRSIWEQPHKYDSIGASAVLDLLSKGDLFDYNRLPVVTLLALLGLGVCLLRRRDERYRIGPLIAIAWLLLYFGRPTWGSLIDLLPMSQDLHLHRLIAGVHLGGILLAAIGLGALWQFALALPRPGLKAAGFLAVGLLLLPIGIERRDYLELNNRLQAEASAAYEAEKQDLKNLTSAIAVLPPGRVYAGRPNNWGDEYLVGSMPVYGLLRTAGLDTFGYLYHALSLNAEVHVLFNDTVADQYDLFNIRYVVAPAGRQMPSFLQPAGDFGRHRLYTMPTTGYFTLGQTPAAFVGSRGDYYPAVARWFAGPMPASHDFPAVSFVDAPTDVPAFALTAAPQILDGLAKTVPSASASPGRIIAERLDDNAFSATVQADRESTLVLKTTYHGNWEARVDGRRVETFQVMPAYLGLSLAPGLHQVDVQYRPQAYKYMLLAVGLLALPAAGLVRSRGYLDAWVARLRFQLPARVPALSSFYALPEVRRPIERLSASLTDTLTARLAVHSTAARFTQWLGLMQVSLQDHQSVTKSLVPIALIGVALLAALPLLRFDLMSGADTLAYLPRHVEFFEGLKAGAVFPRWAPDLAWGYGEPTFNFNPPLLYYLVAFYHTFGLGFVAAEDVALLTLTITAAVGMYLLASRFFGTKGGFVAATAYVFAPYFLVSLYVRYALADFSAFAALPFVFYGTYQFCTSKRYRDLVIAVVSFALLVLSSTSVSLIAAAALGAFVVWLAWAEKDRSLVARGVMCLALGLGLSAFFWAPSYFETDYVQIDRREQRLDYHDHGLYIDQLVSSPWGYGLSVPGRDDDMSFALGPVHLAAAGAALLLLRRVRQRSRSAAIAVAFFVTLLAGAAFMSLDTSLFIWDALSLLHPLQFPWRFLSLAALASALLCAVPFLLLRDPGREKAAVALMALMISTLLLLGVPHAKPDRYLDINEADFSPQQIATQGIAATAREFEPVWVREFPAIPRAGDVVFLSGAGRVLESESDAFDRRFLLQADQAARVRLNTFYFPGWRLYVDGTPRTITPSIPHGLIDFALEPGSHRVQLRFEDTAVRSWSERLSLLTLALLVAGPVLARVAGRRVTPLLGAIPFPPRPAIALSRPSWFALPLARVRLSTDAHLGLGIYLLLLGVYLATASGHFYSTDMVAVYQVSRSLVEDGDLSIDPIINAVRGPDGQHYSQYAPGQSVISIPLYLFGRAVQDLGSNVDAFFSGVDLGDWGGTTPLFFVSLLNQFVTPLTAVIVFYFCRRLGFSRPASLATALAFGLGTQAFVGAHEYFQHALEGLLLLAPVYVLFAARDRLTTRPAFISGALLAAGLLTRVNLVLFVPLVFAYLVWHRAQATAPSFVVRSDTSPQPSTATRQSLPTLSEAPQEPSRLPSGSVPSSKLAEKGLRRGISVVLRYLRHPQLNELRVLFAFVAPLAVAVLVTMYLNDLQFGGSTRSQPSAINYGFSLGTVPTGLFGNLLSPGRSIFLYSPPVLLGLVCFLRFYRDYPAEALLFGLIALGYLLFFSYFRAWHGGWAWGPRYMTAALPFLVIPAAYTWDAIWPRLPAIPTSNALSAKVRRVAESLRLQKQITNRAGAIALVILTALGTFVQILGVVVNVSYVNYDWIDMGLNDLHDPFFRWSVSPIPTHFNDLMDGRHIDLWLLFVRDNFTTGTFVLALAVPVAVACLGLLLLRHALRGEPRPVVRQAPSSYVGSEDSPQN